MKVEQEIQLLNECADNKKRYSLEFRSQLSKVAPFINKKPELYDKLSKNVKELILDNIFINSDFNDDVIQTKVLNPNTKITLNGCQLLVLESNVSKDTVKKIVQNHLNAESWDQCASHVVKEFVPYMTEQQKESLVPQYEKKTKKKI